MPLIEHSSYAAPLSLLNGHVHTLVSALFRKVDPIEYQRERIKTPDNDFLDLDWSCPGADRLAILSHGLEGNSTRPYMLGMARALNESGWDAVAWNYRGCSGEPNATPRLYHSGETSDLDCVVSHAVETKRYSHIALIGFSLGGNVVLKYLGERGDFLAPEVRGGVCFSVGCDLKSSAEQLAQPHNWHLMSHFLRSLKVKIRQKMKQYPELLSDVNFEDIKSFLDFDRRYTAPLHGFSSAEEYWEKCSSRQFLPNIRVPTLLVNALDDPMLRQESFPAEEARKSTFFTLETPKHGGHLGFVRARLPTFHLPSLDLSQLSRRSFSLPSFYLSPRFWSEIRTVEFLQSLLSARV
jgi:uncharacterized protein